MWPAFLPFVRALDGVDIIPRVVRGFFIDYYIYMFGFCAWFRDIARF